MSRLSFALLVFSVPSLALPVEPLRVSIVVGPNAPPLERLAAEEVAEHLTRLHQARVETATRLPDSADPLILIGSPATNPAVKRAVGDEWPRLAPQAHLLKSVRLDGRPALIVGGGSPVATFWAASELGHRWGIRTLLFGNLLPVEPPEFSLERLNVTMTPAFERRGWTLMDASPAGWAAWGLADQKRLLRQLARMKFNRIVLPIGPAQPFVDWKFAGLEKRSAALWPGGPIRVDGDTGGRAAFKGAAVFDNPDFAGKVEYADRARAGAALIAGVIEEAHRLGMTVSISLSPFAFPEEFDELIPARLRENERQWRHAGVREAAAVAEASRGNAKVLGAAAARLRALLDAYPTLDAIDLVAPEGEESLAGTVWAELQRDRTIPRDVALDAVVVAARNRNPDSADISELRLKEQVAALPAIRRLLENRDLFRRGDGSAVALGLSEGDPALGWLMAKIAPDGANPLESPETLATPGQTAQTAARLTARISLDSRRDNFALVMALPELASVSGELDRIRRQAWRGYIVSAAPGCGIDPSIAFAARAAFDSMLTPEAALRDLADRVSGPGAADRVWKAFSIVESAAVITDRTDAKRLREGYVEAMNEMYRANTRARDGAREFTLYYARRYEAAAGYLAADEALREADAAKASGDEEQRTARLEAAIEAAYGALNAHAAVARDPGDRGIIAVLNERLYRRLQKMLE